ncbi:MAG: HAD family hydrolase [Clostridiales bacterium]|nr:HAD family hydrolase [Clostridiales bacterium]
MKALFFDLDGTLLDSNKKIPASAAEALTAAREKGVKVFVCTGRSLRVEKMLGWTTELQLFDGGVYCNGACIYLEGETNYVFIEPKAVRAVLDEVSRYDGVHTSLNGEGAEHAFNFTPPESMMGPWGMKPEDIHPLDDAAINHCTKMLIFYKELVNSTRKLPEELYPRLVERCGDLATMYLTDQGATIQVVSRESSKREGIERVRRALGIAPEELAVFGDDLNDLEMISAYPVSIAMGNAVEEVKAAAKHITRANDEGGIEYALKHILKII